MKKTSLIFIAIAMIFLTGCSHAETYETSSIGEQSPLTTVIDPHNTENDSSPTEDSSLILTNRTTSAVPNSEEEPYALGCSPEKNGDAIMSDGGIEYDNLCFNSNRKEEALKQEVYGGKDRNHTEFAPYGGHLSDGRDVFPIQEYNSSYSARTHHECLEGKNEDVRICERIFEKYGNPEQSLR